MARQPSYLTNLGNALLGRAAPRVSPYDDAGVPGTAIWGGFVENIERDPRLSSSNRYRTVSDLLANVSIVAAGLRYFLNMTAAPRWSIEPAKDMGEGKDSSDQAKRGAEFFEAVLDDMATPWGRIVKRGAMYRFHGFTVQEWTAKRRADGMIGLDDIEARPQHTIEQWYRDPGGRIFGMGQRSPQDGELLYIPRSKTMYIVDDSLTDSPEGMGWARHLIDPGDRIRRYLKLEGQGYERDMRGIPVGRAPLAELRAMVKNGTLTAQQHSAMLKGLRNFLKMQVKQEDTGILLDSTPYQGITDTGSQISPVAKWGLELLTGSASGFTDLGKAIERVTQDMAMILGAEGLLLGGTGTSGNRALAEDKSKGVYINVNGALSDIRKCAERDLRDPVWALNGLPDELKPTIKVEDAAFKDAEAISRALADMASAGAILDPNDPIINDLRDLMGVARQPELTPEQIDMIRGTPPAGEEVTGDGDAAEPEE